MNQLVKLMRPKWMLIGLAAFALLVGVGAPLDLDLTQEVMAQDLPDEEGGEAQPAANNNAPANDAGNEDDEAGGGSKQSMLGWVYEALGPGYMIIFLAISFTLVSLFVMNIITSARSKVCPVELVDDFEEMLNNKQYQDAYEMAKEHESVLGAVPPKTGKLTVESANSYKVLKN